MNLGKLLVAGKSIINGRADISYRANKNVYLPKFGLAHNPFKPPTGAEPVGLGRGNRCRAHQKSGRAGCGKI